MDMLPIGPLGFRGFFIFAEKDGAEDGADGDGDDEDDGRADT